MLSVGTEITAVRLFSLILVGAAYTLLFIFTLRAVCWKLADAPISQFSKYSIAVRFVSAVHGCCSGVVGVVAVRSLGLDFMNDRCPFLIDAMWAFAGYFIYDIVVTFVAHSKQPRLAALSTTGQIRDFWRSQTLIIVHHLSVPFICLPAFTVLFRGRGEIFFAVFFVQELSTPFVSCRFILKHLGLTRTRLYVFNGICLIVAFFFCRVMALPYLFYRYQQFANIGYVWEVPLLLPWHCNLGCLILFAPQYYWFVEILQKALRFRAEEKPLKET